MKNGPHPVNAINPAATNPNPAILAARPSIPRPLAITIISNCPSLLCYSSLLLAAALLYNLPLCLNSAAEASLLLSCAIVFAATLTIQAQSAAKSFDSQPAQTAPATIDREVRADMAFLADDDLHGRGSATRDEHIAALFAASQFQSLGLEPGGANGTLPPEIAAPRSPAARLQQRLSKYEDTPRKETWNAIAILRGSDPAKTRSSCSPPTSTISA